MTNTAIILAGGLGTRLRSVVSDVPKPMAPIRGRPFLAYQLDYWIAQGIERCILSVGYKHQSIIDFFGHTYNGAALDYVIEAKPLGTGGGFLLALEKTGYEEPVLLLNGDTYFDVDLNQLSKFALHNHADWVFSLFSTHDVNRYMGICLSSEKRIESVKSENTSSDSRLANGGVYWIHPKMFAGIASEYLGSKVSLEDDLVPHALQVPYRIFGLEYSGTFIDIGVPDDYYRSTTIL